MPVTKGGKAALFDWSFSGNYLKIRSYRGIEHAYEIDEIRRILTNLLLAPTGFR